MLIAVINVGFVVIFIILSSVYFNINENHFFSSKSLSRNRPLNF